MKTLAQAAKSKRLAGKSKKKLKSILQAKSGVVSVLGVETLSTPAGNFVAWRVGVGNLTAWYDTQPPHMLVSYDNGMVRFVLLERP